MVMYVTDGGQTLATANNWIEIYDGNFHLLRTFTDALAPDAQTVYFRTPGSHPAVVTERGTQAATVHVRGFTRQ